MSPILERIRDKLVNLSHCKQQDSGLMTPLAGTLLHSLEALNVHGIFDLGSMHAVVRPSIAVAIPH